LCLLIVVACDEKNPLGPGEVTSTESFIRALEEQRLTVVRATEMPRESFPFFSVRAQHVRVTGESVYVFEYIAADAALGDASKVSPGGTPIGNSQITWTDPPRFYRQGRIIVLYVGRREDVVQALDTILGPPFAGAGR
jgi:hypothetical protein